MAMSDEERYGKVGAMIRRLDPEAYKNRTDKSAEGNLKLLKELQEKARKSTRKMSGEEFIREYEESDTPAGRTTKTETKVTMEPRRAGQGMSQLRGMMGGDEDSDESPAMRRIRMARELAKAKGPGARGSAVKNMSMAERRMQMAGRTMRSGGGVKAYKKGGAVKSSASKRADGIAQRGKTRGKIV